MNQILFFFLLVTQLCSAQWIWQNPLPQGNSLLGVSFIDANNGTAVGYEGTILRTTDGGNTWTSQSSGTTSYLSAVSFADLNTGTVVGQYGTILRTTNGGTTWISQSTGSTQILRGVSFIDEFNGTSVGESGTILRTTDGGTVWSLQSSGTSNTLQGVSFVDANIGTVVGESGTILRTIDGGSTWTSQPSGTTEWLNSVSFTDANNGTAVGLRGIIRRTTDGGNTWTSQTVVTLRAQSSNLYGVSFTDIDNGTAVGSGVTGDLGGKIFRTTDGGTTWIQESSGTWNELYAVSFTDANNGTVVGQGGKILRYPIPELSITFPNLRENLIMGQTYDILWADNISENVKIVLLKAGVNVRTIASNTPSDGIFSWTVPADLLSGSDYKIKIVSGTTHSVKDESDRKFSISTLENELALNQNYPNPFNPSTKIKYTIPFEAVVSLVVYNVLGEVVAELVNTNQPAGSYEVNFNASELSSAIYFYKLQAGTFVETKKMILMR